MNVDEMICKRIEDDAEKMLDAMADEEFELFTIGGEIGGVISNTETTLGIQVMTWIAYMEMYDDFLPLREEHMADVWREREIRAHIVETIRNINKISGIIVE